MSDEKKIPRLGRAAGEFNVSISSVVSLLKKKHIEIDENPNTKLTPEIYDVLLKEYQSDKLVKEAAKDVEVGTFENRKKEEEKKQVPEILQLVPPTVKPTTEEKHIEVIKVKVEKIQIKEVGRIELEPKKVAKEILTPKVEELKEELKLDLPEEKETQKPEHIDTVIEDLSKKIIHKGFVDPAVLERMKPVKKKENKNRKRGKDEDRRGGKEIKGIKEVKEIKEIKDVKDINVVKEVDVSKRVSEIIEKKETIETKPIVFEKPVVNEPHKPVHIETKHIKLAGPKVVGDVDLESIQRKTLIKRDPKEQQKDKSNTGAQTKRPGKRKRIKKHTKQGDDDKLKQAAAAKVEISDEDIQRQIRETMQRLEPLGKSKTSKRRREKRLQIQTEMHESEMMELENQKKLKVTEFITANDLAVLMNVQVTQIIATCMSIGLFVSINQRLDAETIALLTEEFGFEVEFVGADTEDNIKMEESDKPEDLEPRHPIITVMGHVDHGKTSLLDYIRKTNVIAGEAGGITQHIGAYLVNLPDGRKITFLDTPGHEAFTAMRARGAKVTDLCIIVIAADDSVMPQTVEAINHAQAAGVPMVFAITKIDKQNAAPEKIREALANMNILVEDWGGKYQCQEINSKQGTNIDTLLEKILLEAEMLELKANPNKQGSGTVLESSLDKGKGYVAKVLIQNGNIKIGDPILAGNYFGKVKALYNERNQAMKEAGPATPILLLGLNGAPQAGDILKVCTSEHDARIAATKRAQLAREMGLRTQKHITLDEIGRRIAIGDFKELNIIVKADVDGSVEALSDSLLKLSTEQVQVNVIHKSVGAVTESDVLLASASNAIIVAFQVRPSPGARKLAEQEQIDIRTYSIIYTAINEIKDAIAGMHTPEIREKILCNLELREVFKITKVGNIAGCMVLDGKLQRNTKIRLIRDGIVIYSGKLGSLKRFKDDVKEVVAGQDCGLNIENFNDVKVGDIIEGYEEYEVKVTL